MVPEHFHGHLPWRYWCSCATKITPLMTLMRNCLSGQAPVYLRELCVPVSSLPGRRSVRSAEQGDLVVPRVRLATAQRRSFAVVGPSLWNALPSRLRSELLALSLPLFRSRLKTILFDHGLVLLGRECLWGASPEEALYKLTITITITKTFPRCIRMHKCYCIYGRMHT